MSLSNLSSAQLSRLIGLIKEKESLEAKLDRVTGQIDSLETGRAVPAGRRRGPGRPPGSKNKGAVTGKKRGGRGQRLKQPILAALSSAGSSGISVKDLASKLKVKPSNIFSWFYTTGKKVSGIKKVGAAKYALSK